MITNCDMCIDKVDNPDCDNCKLKERKMDKYEWKRSMSKMEHEKTKEKYDMFETFEILKQTDKAYQVKFDNVEVWLPKSQVENWSTIIESTGEETKLMLIAKWLTEKNGLTKFKTEWSK